MLNDIHVTLTKIPRHRQTQDSVSFALLLITDTTRQTYEEKTTKEI